ncbi:hypothetical protein VPH35_126553 [Triticum aestivum]
MTLRRSTMLIALLVVLLAFSVMRSPIIHLCPIKGEDDLGGGDGGDLAPPPNPGGSHLSPPPPPSPKSHPPPPPKTDLAPPPSPKTNPPPPAPIQPPPGPCAEVRWYKGPCVNMVCAAASIAELHQGGHCRGHIFTGGCYCFVCSVAKSSPSLH